MVEAVCNIDLDNPEFQQAFQLLRETSANVFLTGRAGTGKSTFLKYICGHIRKNYVILAPTGVAAINVGGVTLHSFFQIPLRPVPPDDPEYSIAAFRKGIKISKKRSNLIKKLDLIIIDEISMVRADTIDYVDRLLRGVRNKSTVPFGGIQLLFVGDVFQLEPVTTPDSRSILNRYYPNYFFFNAIAYRRIDLIAIELKKMYRQSDKLFIELLDRVRLNQLSDKDFSVLNSKIKDENEIIDPKCMSGVKDFEIILATRRDIVSGINDDRMESLEGKMKIYSGLIEDEFPKKSLPTDMELSLKIGAQIMTIRNDKEKRWANGTLGQIIEMNPNDIIVKLEDGKIVTVEREVWENISYSYDEEEKKVKEKVIGRFTQFPLKAAWAITIHKSQGLTFSNVTIDMGGGAFTAGQTYVALSRCRSLEGLSFVNPVRPYDVRVNSAVKEFSKGFNDSCKIRSAIEEATAKRLAYFAKNDFLAGKFWEAIEKMWEAHCLTGILGNKTVRRFIALLVGEIRKLRYTLKDKDNKLSNISESLCKAGNKAMKDKKQLKYATQFFEEAIKADPNNLKAHWGMANITKKMGDIHKSKIHLNYIISKKDIFCVDAYIMLGEFAENNKEFESAAIYYETAARFDKLRKKPVKKLISLYKKVELNGAANYCEEWLKGIS